MPTPESLSKESFARKKNVIYRIPPLPYSPDLLEPVLSLEAIDLHYHKHTKAYFDKTNELVEGTDFEHLSLEELVKSADGKLFDQAAQAWNHVFMFSGLTIPESSHVSPVFRSVLAKQFGSFEDFQSEFCKSAMEIFGSGWAWLVIEKNGRLKIDCRSNAGSPIKDGLTPLLTCDVWEHAYYIDYQNERDVYLDSFWKIVNWEMIENRFSSVRLQ
jgi:superoxide dismutase, Fe-Mn family